MVEGKPGIGNLTEFDYMSHITSAKNGLDAISSNAANSGQVVNLPPIFETNDDANLRNEKYVRTNTTTDKVGVETEFDFFSKVFVVYRPWEKCTICKNAINESSVEIPQDSGDYECPHNQSAAYQSCVNMVLKGDAILTHREHFMTQDGVRRVHVEWMKPNEASTRKLKKKAEKKKAASVYPPDVAGAFKKEPPANGS